MVDTVIPPCVQCLHKIVLHYIKSKCLPSLHLAVQIHKEKVPLLNPVQHCLACRPTSHWTERCSRAYAEGLPPIHYVS